jgi:Na+-driven multidrug efflux pump
MNYLDNIGSLVIGMMSGKLNTHELSAYAIMRAAFGLTYCSPLSMGTAVISLIGNSMGEKNIQNAKAYLKAGVILTFGISLGTI